MPKSQLSSSDNVQSVSTDDTQSVSSGMGSSTSGMGTESSGGSVSSRTQLHHAPVVTNAGLDIQLVQMPFDQATPLIGDEVRRMWAQNQHFMLRNLEIARKDMVYIEKVAYDLREAERDIDHSRIFIPEVKVFFDEISKQVKALSKVGPEDTEESPVFDGDISDTESETSKENEA